MKREIQYNNWYDGLPKDLKDMLPEWYELSFDAKKFVFYNPIEKFEVTYKIYLESLGDNKNNEQNY